MRAEREQRGGASLKTLALAPGVKAKKATFALCCETLRFWPVLQTLRDRAGLAAAAGAGAAAGGPGGGDGGREAATESVCVYDLLLGRWQGPGQNGLERRVLKARGALEAALGALLREAGVGHARELLAARRRRRGGHPRYVRANTLKMPAARAAEELRANLGAACEPLEHDAHVADLLRLPGGLDLHDHRLVKAGAVVLQGKSSCMPAQALAPEPGWQVIDACAAPGNKTTHLAALMGNEGTIFAFDADARRLERLKANARATGASIVRAAHQDFLRADPADPRYRAVRGILLDPSCSGSGTTLSRGDHLLPAAGAAPDPERLEALAAFQEAALKHAMRFPGVARIVYSTCSVHARENELVVAAVLAEAERRGFELQPALAAWPRRGLPMFEGCEKLVRVDQEKDATDGFFLALFERGAERGEGAAT